MAKILIVDDEEPIRLVLKDALESDNHEIIEAENGKEAQSLFEKHPFDLVITDIVMPVKNGIDVILKLKEEYPDICIVAITGGGGITGRYDYLPIADMVGADSILRKPFRIEEIRKIVSDLLE